MPKVKLAIGRVFSYLVAIEPHWPQISSILQNFLLYLLSCFSPKIHLQDLLNRFQFVLDENLGHFEANLSDCAKIVMQAILSNHSLEFILTLKCCSKMAKRELVVTRALKCC